MLIIGSRLVAFCCLCNTTNCVTYITYIYKQEGYRDINYLDNLGVAKEEEKAQEMFRILRDVTVQ